MIGAYKYRVGRQPCQSCTPQDDLFTGSAIQTTIRVDMKHAHARRKCSNDDSENTQ